MSLKTKLLKIFLPLVIVLFGIGVMAVLIMNRPAPKKEVKKELGALVDIYEAKEEDYQVVVKGTGTVRAAQEISVIPQVSGRVTYVSPSFKDGGFFKKGELLFKIEDIDYLLALEQAKASKAKAEYELETIKSSARVARTEWGRINKEKTTEPNPLVIYEPQLRDKMASLDSANAAVEQAKLALERTRIKAPFNCLIRRENIDLGQYVSAGNSVATLFGTDMAEIIVPLPLNELEWLIIPSGRARGKGSMAYVQVNIGEKKFLWQSWIVRSLGEVDSKTRMMQVVLSVEDPYGIKTGDVPGPVLAVGTFVDIKIQGKVLSSVISIPRSGFRDDSTVWVMDETRKLRIKKVEMLRVEHEKILIREGLSHGDLVIMTTLSGVANGMKLRPIKEGDGS